MIRLTAAERELVVAGWNDTAVVFPADRCVHELVAGRAAGAPGAVAVGGEGVGLTFGKLGSEGIGIDDDFFALGGDSILALRVTSRIATAFGIIVTARALFDTPTIATLAEVIEDKVLRQAEEAAARLGDS